MDTEFLSPFKMEIHLAYNTWTTDPTRLSYIKILKAAVERYQGEVVDQLIAADPWTAQRGPRKAAESFDEQEARTDREASEKLKTCKNCHGSGTVSTPITHPTNPNLDSWDSRPCSCRRWAQGPYGDW